MATKAEIANIRQQIVGSIYGKDVRSALGKLAEAVSDNVGNGVELDTGSWTSGKAADAARTKALYTSEVAKVIQSGFVRVPTEYPKDDYKDKWNTKTTTDGNAPLTDYIISMKIALNLVDKDWVNEQIADLQTDYVFPVIGNVDKNGADIAELVAQNKTQDTNISWTMSEISGLRARVALLDGGDEGTSNTLAELISGYSDIEKSIESLNSSVTSINKVNTSQTTNITSLQNSVTALKGTGYKSTTTLASLQSVNDTQAADITTLQTAMTSLKGSSYDSSIPLGDMQSAISTLQSDMGNTVTNVSNLKGTGYKSTTTLASLQSGHDAQATAITGLRSDVDTLMASLPLSFSDSNGHLVITLL